MTGERTSPAPWSEEAAIEKKNKELPTRDHPHLFDTEEDAIQLRTFPKAGQELQGYIEGYFYRDGKRVDLVRLSEESADKSNWDRSKLMAVPVELPNTVEMAPEATIEEEMGETAVRIDEELRGAREAAERVTGASGLPEAGESTEYQETKAAYDALLATVPNKDRIPVWQFCVAYCEKSEDDMNYALKGITQETIDQGIHTKMAALFLKLRELQGLQ